MAKSTRYGGPSLTDDELKDPEPPTRRFTISRPMLGEVDRPLIVENEEESLALDGTDSSQFSENGPPSSDSETLSPQVPVPTMESHSKAPGRVTPSTARLTGTGGPRKTPPPSVKKAPGQVIVRSSDDLDEFDDFD